MEEKVKKISAISAEYILSKSYKPAILPDTGGQKFFKPDGSHEQKNSLQNASLQMVQLLQEERIVKKSSLSVGDWDEDNDYVVVHTVKGKHWKHFGKKINEKEILLPEECLFLVDQGLFELWNKGIPLSVQEAYSILFPAIPSLEFYRVYSYLCRLGFTVQRYKREVSTPESTDKAIDLEHISEPTGSDVGIAEDFPSVLPVEETLSCQEKVNDELSKGYAGDLWREEWVRPLLAPEDARSTAAVLSKLQVSKPVKVADEVIDVTDLVDSSFSLDFNVYQTGASVRKSNPGLPDCRICVCRYDDTPPSRKEMSALLRESYPSPVKFAIVGNGTVNFYGMINVDLPTLISLG